MNNPKTENAPRRFLRKKTVAERVGYHPVHLMRKAMDPHDDFPPPVKLGLRAIAFDESEIDAWMERRLAERNKGGAA